MRRIDGADEIRTPSLHSCDEDVVHETALHVWTVEVRKTQNRSGDISGSVRGEEKILLRLAHLAFERLRLARMIFTNRTRERQPVWIHGREEHHSLHARRDRAFERPAHDQRMLFELVVRHADQIKNRVDAGGGRVD